MAMPDPDIPRTSELSTFTLAQVQKSACVVLAANPEAILAYRLLREVLRVPPNDPELAQVKKAVLKSKWVRQLEQSQLSDGSWGRFHTQDTKQKTVFRTTEEAIDRSFALGLEPGDKVLSRVSRYIQDVLQGDV